MTLGPIFESALVAQAVCQKIGLPFCIIGGVALQRWGEPRYTADVDLSVLVEAGREALAAQALIAELSPRIEDAEGFAARTRVVLLRTREGIDIDVVLAGLPFEARVIDRSTLWNLDETASLRTCSAEDLLVMKAFAGRDKDWADVTSVLERQGGKLHIDQVRSELRPLVEAKQEPGLFAELERRIRTILRGNE